MFLALGAWGKWLNILDGVILNIASILGTVGEAGAFAYNASKGVVNLITKSLAAEYSSRNIRINSICPGYVETGYDRGKCPC